MRVRPINEVVLPIYWLIGKWKSVSAKGQYPTLKPFTYCEEIEFRSYGQPLLNYVNRSWNAEEKTAMHLEAGFLRVKPFTNEVAFLVAHNLGVTTVEEGCVTSSCIDLRTKNIGSMSFVRYPPVTEITRLYKYCCDTQTLEMVICMATCNTPLSEHVRVLYKRVPEPEE